MSEALSRILHLRNQYELAQKMQKRDCMGKIHCHRATHKC